MPSEYYSSIDLERISISVATADEEDEEPAGHFKFEIRAKNVTAAARDDLKFDVDLAAYFTKEELKRLHAVFGLLLGLDE